MAQENAEFTELGRIEVSDKKSLVVSSVIKDGVTLGININNFISSAKYTGYSKGVFIPTDKVADMIKLINSKL